MDKMPLDIIGFIKWWLIVAPLRIFNIFRRITILLNNELSFSLNIKLLFTPLFGDYTKAGRLIGFFVRIEEVLFGTFFVGLLFIFSFFTPFIWWALPIYIALQIKLWIVPLIIVAFLIHEYNTSTIPSKRSIQVSGTEVLKAFRPEAKLHYTAMSEDASEVLKKFLNSPRITYLLQKVELNKQEFKMKLNEAPKVDYASVASSAHKMSLKYKTRYVEVEHLFYGYLENIPKIDILLFTFGITLKDIESAVDWVLYEQEEASRMYFWQTDYVLPKMGGIGKGMTGRVTPYLDSVSQDFTKLANSKKQEHFIIHKAEIAKVAEILSSSKVNVLIIGEPGSGKTTIIKNMAAQILQGTEYKSLKFKRIVGLETGPLLAGVKTAGDLATKFKKIMDEVESSGDIILFLDEIHNIVASAGDGNIDTSSAYSILEPYLSSNRIQFVGATNIENYRKYIEPNGSFSRLFHIVEIQQASKEDTLEVLKYVGKKLERSNGIVITLPALTRIIDLSAKLIQDRVFPDKGVDILSRTVVSLSKGTKYLTSEDVAKEISNVTHVPVAALSEDESSKLLNIEDEMKKRVIGQEQAIVQIGSALKRARAGIRNESKPMASFLFVGTTGVGKTETAKTLARTYFGQEKAMIRIDMSEYQQLESMNRLIGTPDNKSKGILTEAVRTSPFSLILLDEIEKAHPNILLVFLQVLDDGRLTDASGRVIDFTNTIIIATSNVGTKAIQEVAQRNGEFTEMQTVAMKEVRDKFAPEFLNRFNGIIVFRPLSLDSVQKIANLMLENVKKMAEAKSIKVFFKPELIQELIRRGYSTEWGARQLARVIENTVESYLAVKMISKELKMGDTAYLGTEIFDDPSVSSNAENK